MEWVQTLMLLVGAGITLGGLAAGFYGARQKGIIELLKTENTAYKESNERLHTENNALTTERDQAKAEAKMWRDNVTQRPNVEKLITTSNKQHGEYMIKMGEMATAITNLTGEVGKALKELANGKK